MSWFRSTFSSELSRSQVEEALALSIDDLVQCMVDDGGLQHATRADLNFESNPESIELLFEKSSGCLDRRCGHIFGLGRSGETQAYKYVLAPPASLQFSPHSPCLLTRPRDDSTSQLPSRYKHDAAASSLPGRRVPPPNHHSADSEPMNMSVYPPIDAATAVPNPLDIPVIDLFPRQSRTVEEATVRLLGEANISSTSTPPFRAVLPAGQGHFREMVDNGQQMTLQLDDSRRLDDDSCPPWRVRAHWTPWLTRVAFNDPFRVASIPIPTAAFFRKQVDVQWISEGPDCLLASSSNFTVHLWHGYQSRLASPTSCSLASTPTINGGASGAKFARRNDISWEDKKPVVYWRGVVQRRSFILTYRPCACTTDTGDCNRDPIVEENNITGTEERVDREDIYVYGYKYASTETPSAGGLPWGC
ncbi:hypothetical protein C8F01DRAFT_1292573 [Mycena amicta]|nr:hypothetical protein C8F01DRAFT_1292573 [Mycena amicta]